MESRREQLPSCAFCNLLLLVTSSAESSVLRCDSRLVAGRRKKSFIHRTKDLKNLKQVATGYHVFRNASRFPSALSPTTALSQASTAPTRYTVRYTVKALVTALDAYRRARWSQLQGYVSKGQGGNGWVKGFENAGQQKDSRIQPFLRARTLGMKKWHKMTPALTYSSVFAGSSWREQNPKNLFPISYIG